MLNKPMRIVPGTPVAPGLPLKPGGPAGPAITQKTIFNNIQQTSSSNRTKSNCQLMISSGGVLEGCQSNVKYQM